MKKVFIFLFLISLSKLTLAQDTIVKINGDIVQAKVTEISSEEVRYKRSDMPDGPFYVEKKSEISYIKYKNGFREAFAPATIPQTIAVETPKTLPAATETNADYYDPKGSSHASISIGPAGPVSTQYEIESLRKKFKYKYDGKNIRETEMQKILMKTNDKEIVALVQSAKDARKMTYIGFVAIPLSMVGFVLLANNNSGSVAQTGGLFCLAASIACPVLSGVYEHKRTVNNKKAVALYNQKY